MTFDDAYEWLQANSMECARLASLAELAAWDQRTYIPKKGHAHRAEQLEMLARLIHARATDPRIGECLDVAERDCPADPLLPQAVNLRMWRRAFDREVKIPASLAAALAGTAARAESAWETAKGSGDFNGFRPLLAEMISLTAQKADCLSTGHERYDALLDEYEPGATAAGIETVFCALRGPLMKLTADIAAQGRGAELPASTYPLFAQRQLCAELVAAIGYDLQAGRIDETVHPFTIGIGPGDVRITTRYTEDSPTPGLFGCLHEAGHALYDQGLDSVYWGTPMGSAVSLGIHESQSRLWENLVGRSAAFWRWAFPRAAAAFDGLRAVPESAFVRAVNGVRPGFVRVEADEVTYNLHVLLRFELERSLFRGDLTVADLQGAWNEKMQAYLGLVPRHPGEGVLQDVHWSAGLFGYFPTYTLGNLYAAQLFAAADSAVGPLEEQFARGEFGPLLDWLRKHVHLHGQRFTAEELITRATGAPPSQEAFISYLTRKYTDLYALDKNRS